VGTGDMRFLERRAKVRRDAVGRQQRRCKGVCRLVSDDVHLLEQEEVL